MVLRALKKKSNNFLAHRPWNLLIQFPPHFSDEEMILKRQGDFLKVIINNTNRTRIQVL